MPVLQYFGVHLIIVERMEQILLLNLFLLLLKEGQILKIILEFYEVFQYALLGDVLLEETADVETLLIENEVHEGDRIEHELFVLADILQTEF